MLILEFDGDNHYKSAEKIKSEESKNQIFHNLGYKIIRIPYFVQLTKQVMENLFGIDFTPEYKFPHGFISKIVFYQQIFVN
jgi:very-short-patch-repair endonuclease